MGESKQFAELVEIAQGLRPEIAFVLGSGMGHVVDRMHKLCRVSFAEIPGLSAATVPGHRGQFTLAQWQGRTLLVLEGRLHRYEGHSWERVILPVQSAATLGVRVILNTNAAGGIHEALVPGSLMVVTDHLEW